MSLLKSSRRIRISNSTLNAYGFRLLTSGADMSLYEGNPILLWMHNRSWRGTDDEVLPIGRLEDIKIEGDDITGLPVFDADDPFAVSIYQKYEKGILNMCSVGFDTIEASSDPAVLVPGQRYETVTKWLLKEVSIVDIGANRQAMALYYKNKLVVLNDDGDIPTDIIRPLNNSDMVELKDLASKLKLAETATPNQLADAIDTLVADKAAAEQKVQDLGIQLSDLKKRAVESEVEAQLSDALEVGKITVELKKQLAADYGENPEGLKKVLAAMPAHKTIGEQLGDKKPDDTLLTASWDELDRANKLADLKTKHPDIYKEKFRAKFGKDPK